jgi:hypothetical protein
MSGLGSSAINPVDAKFCIINLRSISQAGRRGFDPRLPLQEIQQFVDLHDHSEMIEYVIQQNDPASAPPKQRN